MNWFELILRFALGFAALRLATQRGRDPILWSVLTALFVFPIVVLLILSPAKKQPASPSKKPEEPFLGETLDVKPLSKEEELKKESSISFQTVSWYLLDKERKSEGPLTFSELQSRFWEGGLSEESFVWTPDWKEWKKVGTIPGLLKTLSQ